MLMEPIFSIVLSLAKTYVYPDTSTASLSDMRRRAIVITTPGEEELMGKHMGSTTWPPTWRPPGLCGRNRQ